LASIRFFTSSLFSEEFLLLKRPSRTANVLYFEKTRRLGELDLERR